MFIKLTDVHGVQHILRKNSIGSIRECVGTNIVTVYNTQQQVICKTKESIEGIFHKLNRNYRR